MYFKVYRDENIGLDFSKFQGKTIHECDQDDDLESDQDIVENGHQRCMADLMVAKAALRLPLLQQHQKLSTYKLWAPLFGRLPRRR